MRRHRISRNADKIRPYILVHQMALRCDNRSAIARRYRHRIPLGVPSWRSVPRRMITRFAFLDEHIGEILQGLDQEKPYRKLAMDIRPPA